MSLRWLTLLLYAFLGLTVFTGIPVNEYTAKWVYLGLAAYVAGLVLILGAHYILPRIFKEWCLCGCRVVRSKYIVCTDPSRPGEARVTALVKIIPRQPIAEMENEQRLKVLSVLSGLLQGVGAADVGICYDSVRSTYGEDIRDRLERKLAFRSALASMGRRMSREVEKLDRELRLLERMPFLLEGFYTGRVSVTARVGDTGIDPGDIEMLESAVKTFKSRLESAGFLVREVWGEELNNLVRYVCLGSVHEESFF